MEKERLDKVRRYWQLEVEWGYVRDHYLYDRRCQKNGPVMRDLLSLIVEIGKESRDLFFELYPEPPKDLMEDLKIRLKKYHEAKAEIGWPSGNVKMGFMARIKRFIK